MATKTVNSKIVLRNDTAANWNSSDPQLLKGEIGIENDTRKFKIGNGVSTWSALDYASATPAILQGIDPTINNYAFDVGTLWVNTATDRAWILVDVTTVASTPAATWKKIIFPEDIGGMGQGDMTKAVYAAGARSAQGYVDKAEVADKLTAARAIALDGDVTGTATSFDGSANITIPVTLDTTGVSAGTYTKVTVDTKGRVTAGAGLAASDIPNLTLAKITDAGTAAAANTGTASGNVPVLDTNGKLNTSVIPSLAIMDVYTVANEAAMLALGAQKGDIAIRTDLNKSFILAEDNPAVLANWKELLTPTDAVTSVNTKTGAVVLTTTDINEGTNLYYTTARFNTDFATKASTGLTDTGNIAYFGTHAGDTYIVDGGTASSAG